MSEPIHGELLEVPAAGSRRRESFDDFYAAELPRLVALARGLCGAALAEDVAQEAMVELRVKARISVRRPPPEELDETSEEFWTAVRALPHRQAQAQAAALRFVYAQSIADIAHTLGCSEGTVKQHLSRARKSLAAALDLESTEES